MVDGVGEDEAGSMKEDGIIVHLVFRPRLDFLRQHPARRDGVVERGDVVEATGGRWDRLSRLPAVRRRPMPARFQLACRAATPMAAHWEERDGRVKFETARAGVLGDFLVNAGEAGLERRQMREQDEGQAEVDLEIHAMPKVRE